MRAVGEFKEEEMALAFSAYLRLEGISNEVEEDEGLWTIWVEDEGSLDRAARELERYLENPHRSDYLKAVHRQEGKPKSEKAVSRGRYKRIDLGRKWHTRVRAGIVTVALIVMTAVVFLLTQMGKVPSNQWLQFCSITEYEKLPGMIRWHPGLPEVSSWQIWRLLTPIFIHFGPIHFLFNMMWLFDLGGMLESRKGAWFLGLFVLLTGVASNLGQYLINTPAFGGMSGVVYALFGYAWMKGRLDPGDGIGVPSSTVIIMMGWFLLCFAGVFPNIANEAHAIGLVSGMIWGSSSAVKWRR